MTSVKAAIGLAVLTAMSLSAAVQAAPPKEATPIDADAPAGFVKEIKVVADKAPDCSSLKSIVETVTRDCKTNDEKGIAIYNAARMLYYHRQYPGEKGGIAALKLLNVYGWSLCGGQHTALAALWRAAGWEWRYIGWSNPGHTTVECKYDGQWHYYDTFLKYYGWRADPNAPGGRTVASQEDIKKDNSLITEGLVLDKGRAVYFHKDNIFEIINDKANWQAPAFLVCGDGPGGIITGTKSNRQSGSGTGWAGIKFDEDGYNTHVNLAPGYSLELLWKPIEGAHWYSGRKNVPVHGCGDKEYRNCPAIGPVLEPYKYLNPRGHRSFASGFLRFAPDLSNDAFMKGLAAAENAKWSKGQIAPAEAGKPASVTVYLQSPYIMSRAKGSAEGVDKAELSIDGGKTFKEIKLDNFDDDAGGQYAALLKLTFSKPVTAMSVEVIVQHNRCALPYLSPGPNKVTVTAADAEALGDNKLVVTYAYAVGSRNRSYEQVADRGAEVGRAHYADWSDTPTVVQKVFSAKDLPATIDVPVPTPKDAQPVYPRMLFLRREVIAPSGKPSPLPEGAVEPKVGPTDELKTLPNPFLVGIAPPPKKIARATVTKTVPLAISHVVYRNAEGKTTETFPNHYLKTKTNSKETWVMLIGGEVKDLPAVRDIAAARLCLPVVNGAPQAPTKVGAFSLNKPFAANEAYNLDNLGGLVGTAVVPKYEKESETSKIYKIDVTRAIKAVAAGEAKWHGLAVMGVPDRGVDDGWIVRIDVTKNDPTFIELDIYQEAK